MASGITREEMLRQINSPEFNTRCNNYFYTNVKNGFLIRLITFPYHNRMN